MVSFINLLFSFSFLLRARAFLLCSRARAFPSRRGTHVAPHSASGAAQAVLRGWDFVETSALVPDPGRSPGFRRLIMQEPHRLRERLGRVRLVGAVEDIYVGAVVVPRIAVVEAPARKINVETYTQITVETYRVGSLSRRIARITFFATTTRRPGAEISAPPRNGFVSQRPSQPKQASPICRRSV